MINANESIVSIPFILYKMKMMDTFIEKLRSLSNFISSKFFP